MSERARSIAASPELRQPATIVVPDQAEGAYLSLASQCGSLTRALACVLQTTSISHLSSWCH